MLKLYQPIPVPQRESDTKYSLKDMNMRSGKALSNKTVHSSQKNEIVEISVQKQKPPNDHKEQKAGQSSTQ